MKFAWVRRQHRWIVLPCYCSIGRIEWIALSVHKNQNKKVCLHKPAIA